MHYALINPGVNIGVELVTIVLRDRASWTIYSKQNNNTIKLYLNTIATVTAVDIL